MFFRELLWGGGGIAPRFIVLWLSRLLYIVFFLFYIFIIKGNKIYMVENNSLGDGFKLPK